MTHAASEINPLEGFVPAPVVATRAQAAAPPRDGISLAQFRAFLDRHHAQLVWKSTRQAVDDVIRPATAESRCSYLDLLRANEAVASSSSRASPEKRAAPIIGPATVVVSHAWDAPFENLVFALEARLGGEEPGRCFVWLDALCVTQHSLQCAAAGCGCGATWDGPGAEWCAAGALREFIAGAGRLVLVLDPWDSPLVLGRTWCLWVRLVMPTSPRTLLLLPLVPVILQAAHTRRTPLPAREQEALCAIQARAAFDVAMSPHLEADFAKAVKRGELDTVLKAIAGADLAASESTDREAVLAAAEAASRRPAPGPGGAGSSPEEAGAALPAGGGPLAKASAAVRHHLRSWLFARALAVLDALSSAERAASPLGPRLVAELRAHGRAEEAEAVLREYLPATYREAARDESARR